MKFFLFLLVPLILLTACSSENTLISDGHSSYHIFVSKTAPAPEQYAATELQKYLFKISNVKLEIVNDAAPDAKLIYVGFTGAPENLLAKTDTAEFINEEYLIRSDGKNLLIAGGGTRGTLYGVLGYLSDYLGCRWYTRDVVKTPKISEIRLTKMDDWQKPAFEYREAWYREAYDTEWALHNRLNPSTVPIPDSLGGSYIMFPFVHTFYDLLAPGKYFKSNPEYFSEVAGKRIGKDGQLCLTNPEVVKIATATVFEWIKTHPHANVFSIDQNDGEGFCECVHCKALDDKEGSHSGSLLNFVNQIADSVKKARPDIKLQTLAYAYTEIPPKTIRPADNVTIRLCHYNYCSAHSILGCDNHKPFIARLDQWKKISKNITIWDYFTDFAQYLMPFPNFETLKHDVKFYADKGVIGLFAQGSNIPENGDGEFTGLRAWVFSQLMWKPDQDAQLLIDEFVENVYGNAGSHISAYINLLHEQVKPDSVYFSIWSQPTEVNYLSPEIIRKADSLFVLAKKSVASDSGLSSRVELAYLPVLYTKLFFYSIGGTAYLTKTDLPAALTRFDNIIQKHRIKAIGDMPTTYGNLAAFRNKVVSANTFITDWKVIGPFDNQDAKALARVLGPEQDPDAIQSHKGIGGAVLNWKNRNDKTSGYVDFTKIFKPTENVVAYAFRKVNVPADQKIKFGVGSNDGVKVWINNKLVLDRPLSRKAEPNQDTIQVPLHKGENTILVKVDQLKRAWGFYFTEIEQNKRIMNLTISPEHRN